MEDDGAAHRARTVQSAIRTAKNLDAIEVHGAQGRSKLGVGNDIGDIVDVVADQGIADAAAGAGAADRIGANEFAQLLRLRSSGIAVIRSSIDRMFFAASSAPVKAWIVSGAFTKVVAWDLVAVTTTSDTWVEAASAAWPGVVVGVTTGLASC